jgi:preprotein translocase subunit SecA
LFEGMLVQMRDQVTSVLSHIELRFDIPTPPPQSLQFAEHHEPEPAMAEADYSFLDAPPPLAASATSRRDNAATQRSGGQPAGPRAPWAGTGRNSPCPCGSGKKFKHCHGRI